MEWIYDQAANLFGLSHDWAVLVVQLGIVFGSILLLIFLVPPKFSWWFERRFFEREVGYVHLRLSNGYVHYWHQWGMMGLSDKQRERQKRLLDAGVDYILEICMKHNLERVVKNEPLDFDFSDIKKVIAAWAGYVRDVRVGEEYRWILELQKGRFVYVRGWFDPSGHEQRTLLFTWSADTAEEAAQMEVRLDIMQTNPNVIMDQDVYLSLLDQIKSGERDWSGFKLGHPTYAP